MFDVSPNILSIEICYFSLYDCLQASSVAVYHTYRTSYPFAAPSAHEKNKSASRLSTAKTNNQRPVQDPWTVWNSGDNANNCASSGYSLACYSLHSYKAFSS